MSRNDDILSECHDHFLDPFGEDYDECPICSGYVYPDEAYTCELCDTTVCSDCKTSCSYCKVDGCGKCFDYDIDTGLYFCPDECKDHWYEENPE